MADRPTVVVPLRVLERETILEGIPALLAEAHVVLLGYHEIPDQTAPGQARESFGDRATSVLDELTETLVAGGATVDTQVVFTHDAQTTVDRISRDHDALAVPVPTAVADVEDVLVAVRGTVGIDRLARLVAGLFGGQDVDPTLYHIARQAESDADATTLLQGVTDRLIEDGVDGARLESRVARDVDPTDAIADLAAHYDAVVIGESDPTVVTYFFGLPAEQVAERFLGPVLVVQREPPVEDESS